MRHNSKTIVDSLTVPTFVVDIDHTVIAWNRACELLTGIDADDIIGTKDAWRGFYSSERPCLANVVLNNNKQQLDKYYPINGQSKFSQGLHAENWFENMNGKKRYLIFDAEPIYDDETGELIGALENLEDVTEIKQVELRERTHNEVMAQLIKGSDLHTIFSSLIDKVEQQDPYARCSIMLLDDNQVLLTEAAHSLPEFYNYSLDSMKLSPTRNDHGLAAVFTHRRSILADIESDPRWQNYKNIASVAHINACWSEPIFDRSHTFLGVFVVYYETKQSPSNDDLQFLEFASNLASLTIEQNTLRQQQQLSSRVFNGTLEGITITNPQGVILDVNPAFTKITGYDREEVIGKTSQMLSARQESPKVYQEMWNALKHHGQWQGELWNRHKSGKVYAELLSISSFKDENGKIINYVGVFSDITESKQQQEKLNLMAHYDVLTGLPNRVLFLDRFEQAVLHAKRTNTLLAIMFLDLDKFKPVNDKFGHEVGDKLLIEVSTRLKNTIRQDDTASRQGGDEFAILLSDINSVGECEELARRIHRSLAEPYNIDTHEIEIGASSGIVLFPQIDADVATLIRYSDQAMYTAKLHGRNRFHIFTQNDSQVDIDVQNRLVEIAQALEQNQFTLYYQPKVDLQNSKIYGVEALIRWIHPEKGVIPPYDFLPFIEHTDLEIDVGNWVFQQAFRQLNEWKLKGVDIRVSINITSAHILSESFYNNLDQLLLDYPDIDSEKIQIEILESSALGDLKAVTNVIQACQHKLGVKFALDDFGTGYSSLTHMRNLPANVIKIDRSFVRDLLEDAGDAAIVEGIIGLASAFGRSVVAEGVETTEHGLMLLIMGCTKLQGFGIAKPMPAEDFCDWLNKYKPNPVWTEYVRQSRTAQSDKIKQLQLIADHWLAAFTAAVNASHESIQYWPILNHEKCYCGQWIERSMQEKIFSDDILDNLAEHHELMHAKADQIRHDYKQGNVMKAREQLSTLQHFHDEMLSTLAQCLD